MVLFLLIKGPCMKTTATLTNLLTAQAVIYNTCGLVYEFLAHSLESKDYGACVFKLDSFIIHFRIAKITPTKVGQFVTLWKRSAAGLIIPYDTSDPFDFIIVSVRNNKNSGLFIFPKKILYEKKIISRDCKGGKRAMRLYAPWDVVQNQQAAHAQKWQCKFFVELEPIANSTQLKKVIIQQDQ